MKGNNKVRIMKKKVILIVLAAMMISSVMFLAGCGKSVEGRWYLIHNTAYENSVNFEKDGTVQLGEDPVGTWTADGDTVTVNSTFTLIYNLDEYKGCTVLSIDGEPEYCREKDLDKLR